MNDPIAESDLEFDGELLVPRINLTAYRQIYALEGWLRRICLTAWMGRYGEPWRQQLDQGLRKTLESRVQRSRQRLYLGAESASDLIWQATQAELTRMLVAEPVTEMIRSLTGTDSEFLKVKLEEIREIRNLLAHNRALSRRTHIILAGLLASLEDAVDTFKANLLYRQSDPATIDGLISNKREPFQGFIAQRGDFNEFVCLPVERFGRWPDARLLLRTFREHLDGIVAFCLNKTGDEFIILSPLVLADESREAIHEKFIENRNVWTMLLLKIRNHGSSAAPRSGSTKTARHFRPTYTETSHQYRSVVQRMVVSPDLADVLAAIITARRPGREDPADHPL